MDDCPYCAPDERCYLCMTKRDKHIGTWVDTKTYEAVAEHADKHERSVSQTIIYALRQMLERENGRKK